MIKKHTEGICPVCGSDMLDYGEIELDDGGCIYPVECIKCGTTFTEAYNFVFDDQYDIKRGEFKK